MHGKRVLVTGSSRGIGRAIALRLAEGGWQVATHYNQDREAAESLVAELGSAASGLYQANMGSSERSGLWDAVLQDGPVDALVNNAGIYKPAAFHEASLKETFDVNFVGPYELTQKAVASFLQRGSGKVLMVGSRVGFKGEGGAATYAASKAALLNLVRSLAVEYADRNIGFFGIAPGWVQTAMSRDGMPGRLDEILKTLPLGRMATPEDCAAAVAFLLSDEAAYLSGQTIDINGASYFH
ncbi:SDR family oxidoreductase [bacterium]|nr:MAG: SDR family oxidoreductase [bacterium]